MKKQTFYHISTFQLLNLSERLGITIAEILGVASPKEFWKVTFHERYAIALYEESGHVVFIPAFQVEGDGPGDSPARLVKENRADIHHGGVAYQLFRVWETGPNGDTLVAFRRCRSYEEVYEFLREQTQKQEAGSEAEAWEGVFPCATQ